MLWLSKKNRKLSSRSRRYGDRGFTLIEVLVVVVIVGVLSAIAAPGWVSFLNNNRLSASQSRVYSTLRDAQATAKRRKTVLDFNIGNDATNGAYVEVLNDDGSVQTQRQYLESGVQVVSVIDNVGGATPITYALPVKIRFDSQGLPKYVNQTVAIVTPLRITLSPTVNSKLKRCTTISTILGATRSGADTECN